MRLLRLSPLPLAACFIVLSAFIKPDPAPRYFEKNVVFKVNYDARANELNATERMDVNRMYIERNMEGKIDQVNKEAIVNEMRFSARVIQSLAPTKSLGNTYALVCYRVAEETKGSIAPSDEQLLDYLKSSFESYSRKSFRGTDYFVSGKTWYCAGGSCADRVPTGIDVFVWTE